MPEEIFSEADFTDRPRRLADAPRVRLASVAAGDRPDDLARVAHALDRLTDRIEASETRTGLAITGIEHSVRQAIARIETAERQTLAVATRLDQAGERLDLEALRDATGPRSETALRAIYGEGAAQSAVAEDLAGRLAERLSGAEARTAEAVDALRTSLAILDSRLRSLEGGAPLDIDRRLEALAADLGARVEAARVEAVTRLQASSAQGVEARLAEMAGHVAAAEQRSARAIERMGQEVLSLADAMARRLASAEQQAAVAVEQVGGEIARIGAVVESRLSRAEQAQADALEKLGAEIGRVTERLTDRVAQSERRTAQAIDDVGEQVALVTERMENRHERLSGDVAERLRQSEERTAKLLETAREGLDASLAGTRERLAEAAADDPPPTHAFGPELFARAEAAPAELHADDSAPLAGEALAAAEDFTPLSDGPDEAFLDVDAEPEDEDAEADAAVEQGRPLSTREVIEQARLAARGEAAGAAGPHVAGASIFATAAERRAGGRPGARRVFSALGFRAAARPPSTWQTALMLAGGAAFLSVGAAGVVLMEGRGSGSVMPEAASAPLSETAPRAAVALAPQPLGPTAPTAGEIPAEPSAPKPQPSLDYAAAVRDIETGQAGGLARLKAIAEAGYAPAEFYLAKLYETGVSGVIKNPAEARRWTTRAAEGGDRSAMHNLALYYFRGEGGPQDLSAAAKWFREAAQAGVVDSQYNLGLLYESGSGVERDLAEAYKWFSIAAAGGDGQARANAVDLEAKLSPAALAAADKAVAAYRPRSEIAAQAEASGSTRIASAQRVLGKLGYFHGSPSGAASPELKSAVQSFQRDHELPQTGALDPNTLSQMSVFTR
ncbi:peptidoglycan-binding protein [Phenylobacterium sp.]|uniref:peptidoglycan-binding protein n=1 Tax=Phenylobacterium sp. TaxID=1871053 RepID=UPI002DF136B6|nr:peptidoglycan-binding protein [Phenylobacterium sp.]